MAEPLTSLSRKEAVAVLGDAGVPRQDLDFFPSNKTAQIQYLATLRTHHPEKSALINFLEKALKAAETSDAPKAAPARLSEDYDMKGISAAVVSGCYGNALDVLSRMRDTAKSKGKPAVGWETLKQPGSFFTSARIRVYGTAAQLLEFESKAHDFIA